MWLSGVSQMNIHKGDWVIDSFPDGSDVARVLSVGCDIPGRENVFFMTARGLIVNRFGCDWITVSDEEAILLDIKYGC